MVVELPYTLHTRYASIVLAWTVILIPPIFLNLGLFYGLWYGRPGMDRIIGLFLPLRPSGQPITHNHVCTIYLQFRT